jgi:hypothetical protein
VNPKGGMFEGLARLRDLGFAPTNILDVSAYESDFSRGARVDLHISIHINDRRPGRKGPVPANVCLEVGNADYVIAMLGDMEMKAAAADQRIF